MERNKLVAGRRQPAAGRRPVDSVDLHVPPNILVPAELLPRIRTKASLLALEPESASCTCQCKVKRRELGFAGLRFCEESFRLAATTVS